MFPIARWIQKWFETIFWPDQKFISRRYPAITVATGISNNAKKGTAMLYTIAVVLLILWLLGLVSAYTIGGFIHVLLVIAIVLVLLRLITGRKPM